MTSVNVYAGAQNPTHDVSLSNGNEVVGLRFDQDYPGVLNENPMSEPSRQVVEKQNSWIGGKGRKRFRDDPTGYSDCQSLWTMTDGKLFPAPQWKFASGLRSVTSYMPGNMVWHKLLSGTAKDTALSSSATYNADKVLLWIRRVGNPGTLTVEHKTSTTVNKTVTKTTADITDTVSTLVEFDWTTTQAQTSGSPYTINVYGAATDTESNHWEVGTDGTYLYYRVPDADVNRRFFMFYHYGAAYAIAKYPDSTAPKLFIMGDRGKATAATGTTLSDSGKSWTADEFIGCYIRIIEGTGDGQVRAITDNDTTSVTVATWDINPSTDSLYVIYGTEKLREITGHGLTTITGRPQSFGKGCYLPQGSPTDMRKMTNTTSTPSFAAVTGEKATYLTEWSIPLSGNFLVEAMSDTCVVKKSGTGATSTSIKDSPVGGTDFQITNVYGTNDKLIIAKEDGLFESDKEATNRIGLGLSSMPNRNNGVGMHVHNGTLYFGWGNSIMRRVGQDTSDMMNYKANYEGTPTNRKGYCSAITSALGWVFAAWDGGASNYSSVTVWNGMGWDEIFRGWKTGARIRDIFVQSNPDTRSRLWIDINGELVYMDLPLDAANPLLDTSLPFQHEGVWITGTFDFDKETFYKFIHSDRISSVNLGANTWIELDYQTDAEVGSSTWHPLDTVRTSPLKEVIFDKGEILQARFRYRLLSQTATTPAIITETSVEGWITEPLKYQWVARFMVDSYQTTIQGSPDFKPDAVVDFLQTAAERTTKLIMRSRLKTMDDKIVNVSPPVINRTYIEGNNWGGGVTIAIREA